MQTTTQAAVGAASPMQTLALAVLQSAQAIERATLWPWVVTLDYFKADGKKERTTVVVQSTLAAMPEAADLIPADADLLRADVFPATRFNHMSATTRDRYRSEYKAFLLWRKANALGKTVAELVLWVDYDAVYIDESVLRWAQGSTRFCGD